MKKSILVMAVLLFVSSMAFGQFYDGNQLYGYLMEWESKSEDKSHFEAGLAGGYVIGVYDSLTSFAYDSFNQSSNISIGQVIDVVIKYLREHPESRHLRANILVNRAILEAWPIKKEPYKNEGSKNGIK